jgi:hypothetical protein
MEIAVHRLEEGNTLKWSIPSGYNMNCTGRVISGINCFKHRKREYLFRDWLCMKNFEGEASLSICADGAYSYDITGNRVNISLMQVQADGNNRGGSGIFRFRFIPGYTGEIMDNSFNNADLFNNPPLQLKGCHTGRKNGMYSGIAISDSSINLQSVMLNEKGDLVIRLLNPTKEKKRFNIRIPGLPGHAEIEIEAKMIKTLIAGKLSGRITETDLYERKQ